MKCSQNPDNLQKYIYFIFKNKNSNKNDLELYPGHLSINRKELSKIRSDIKTPR